MGLILLSINWILNCYTTHIIPVAKMDFLIDTMFKDWTLNSYLLDVGWNKIFGFILNLQIGVEDSSTRRLYFCNQFENPSYWTIINILIFRRMKSYQVIFELLLSENLFWGLSGPEEPKWSIHSGWNWTDSRNEKVNDSHMNVDSSTKMYSHRKSINNSLPLVVFFTGHFKSLYWWFHFPII